MDTNSALTQHISEVSSKKILIDIHFVLCLIALWSIIPTYHYYRIWYFATAAAVSVTFIFALLGAIRTDNLLKAMIPIIVYFAYLFITSIWAIYPLITINRALVDLILLFIFGLFYLVGLNNSLDRIANTYILAVYPAAAAAYFYYGYYPGLYISAERPGWTGLYLIPYALPFCLWKIKTTNGRKGLFAFLVIILLIFIAKTRAPILIAGVIVPLTIYALSKNLRSFLVFSSKVAIIMVMVIGVTFVFEKPRSLFLQSFERFQGEQEIGTGEGLDVDWIRAWHYQQGVRWLIESQPLGIGYFNVTSLTENLIGVEMSMHPAFLAWGVEGGIICLLIVFYLLYRFFSILQTMIKESDSDKERDFYKAVKISMVGVLIYGLFNQAHQAPTLFVLLGIAYSLPYRRKPT